MAIPEYSTWDGLAMAALVRAGKVSALELLDEAIARAERLNPQLNALVTPLYEDGRRAAAAPVGSGPFSGVPFLLKDLIAAMAGTRLTWGTRLLASYVSPHDTTLVARHRAAGLVIFGKTNTPELGLTPFTEPALFGPTRNPWQPEHTPGGSSGGAAAAVAAGIVPLAHANDGGGSIRIPASCCGLFGLKPTRGRTPAGPDATEQWNGMAIDHVVSISVRDSAAMLDATAGPEATSPFEIRPPARPYLDEVGAPPGRLRVAMSKRPHLSALPLAPDCIAAVDDASRLLGDLGHIVEEADLPIDGETFMHDFFAMVCLEMATLLATIERGLGRRARRGELETSTAITAVLGRQQTAMKAALARDRLAAAAREVARFFERFDVLLTPTLGTPPFRIGALQAKGAEAVAQEIVIAARLHFLLRLPGVVEASVRRVFAFIPFTPVANVTGQPAMSVPLWWNAAGLPIGVQLAARTGDEATLFRLAAQLESARPWRDRRPPIHAG